MTFGNPSKRMKLKPAKTILDQLKLDLHELSRGSLISIRTYIDYLIDKLDDISANNSSPSDVSSALDSADSIADNAVSDVSDGVPADTMAADDHDNTFDNALDRTDIADDLPTPGSDTNTNAMTLGERYLKAIKAIMPSEPPAKIVGRDNEMKQLCDDIVAAVRGGKGLSYYVCGMSGSGKTVSVREVLYNTLRKEIAESSFDLTQATGPSLTRTCCFQYLAERIGFGSMNEIKAKAACMKVFCPTNNQLKRNCVHYIVFIDEIDMAPMSAVEDLYKACGNQNSRLILIGVGNLVRFPEKLSLPEDIVPKLIVFKPLALSEMIEILESRVQGLMAPSALKLLALKFQSN
jgi:AAA ATPase domain